jgi:hypothetical protein
VGIGVGGKNEYQNVLFSFNLMIVKRAKMDKYP